MVYRLSSWDAVNNVSDMNILSIPLVFRKSCWAFQRGEDGQTNKFFSGLLGIQRKESQEQLVCKLCGYTITFEEERIEVAGGHVHRFENPHGSRFQIGCFNSTIGCVEVGETTEEFTWFPGYSWRVVLCVSCQEHLGWIFSSRKNDIFFGLILMRLSVTY